MIWGYFPYPNRSWATYHLPLVYWKDLQYLWAERSTLGHIFALSFIRGGSNLIISASVSSPTYFFLGGGGGLLLDQA